MIFVITQKAIMMSSSGAPEQALQELKTISYFRGVDEDALSALARSIMWRSYVPGALLFSEGEVITSLYHISQGWVKAVRISSEGREQVLRFLGPGETFNEVGMLIAHPSPATIIAMEAAQLWLIPRDAARQMFATHPAALLQVMENMAVRLASLVDLVSELSLYNVETRLVRWLLAASSGDDVVHRQRWATQAALASHLGTAPDVLRRSLRLLEVDGLIEVHRKFIRIKDRAGLEARIGRSE